MSDRDRGVSRRRRVEILMLQVSSLANSGLATVWSANMGEAPEERHVYSGVDQQQKAPARSDMLMRPIKSDGTSFGFNPRRMWM